MPLRRLCISENKLLSNCFHAIQGGNLVRMQPCFVLKNPPSHSIEDDCRLEQEKSLETQLSAQLDGNNSLRGLPSPPPCNARHEGLKGGWKRKVAKVSHSKPLKYRILPSACKDLYQFLPSFITFGWFPLSCNKANFALNASGCNVLRCPEASASRGDCSLA